RVLDFLVRIAKGGPAAILGGFGTGKCVTGDTFVHTAAGGRRRIEDLFAEARGTVTRNPNETTIHLSEPIEVFSLEGQRVTTRMATHLYRGLTEGLVSIRTKNRRHLSVTPVHKLFRVRDRIEEVPAMLLSLGNSIAI